MGIRFPNPVGIAAGFDKNAGYTELLQGIGFGYAEYGSITAQPSPGNPYPRMFRLPKDRALINRMGLNNDGAETICRRITQKRKEQPALFKNFPAGINIAKTHDPGITGDDAVRDYMTSYSFARNAADYITLNISCPNTSEGKTFEEKHTLMELLDGIFSIRQKNDPPLLVKFSPDTSLDEFRILVAVCEDYDTNGYVLSNTSSVRKGLKTPTDRLSEIGQGGLSGAPLFQNTRERVGYLRKHLPKNKVLVGCGGIDTPDKALTLLNSGADLLQIYSGMIYEGPGLIPKILDAVEKSTEKHGA